MASRTWKFVLNEREHVVTLDHNFWSTRRVITLDGKTIEDRTPIDNLRHEYEFSCERHKLRVVVGRTYWTLSVSYELHLDGKQMPADTSQPSGRLLRPAKDVQTEPDILLRSTDSEESGE